MRTPASSSAAAVALAATVVALGTGEAAGVPAASSARPAPANHAPLLDVPYLPQPPDLCGGAAVSMVLRYWGVRQVFPEDFAPLIDDAEAGIRTGTLTGAVRDRGWRAHPFAGDPDSVRQHLARGRPLIALIEVAPARYHYVVLIGWAAGLVVLHDPARAPFQVVSEAAFVRAWEAGRRWTLLILPLDDSEEDAAPRDPDGADRLPGRAVPAGCAPLVDEGVRLARATEIENAEAALAAAARLCPDAAAPLRELAGVRFLERRWHDAAQLAGRAAHLEPDHAYTWNLLASSRYLAGDHEGALRAWNRIGEPRIDLTRVEGASRTRHAVIAGLLNLEPRAPLTDRDFRRARRRLAALPAAVGARLAYRPVAGGLAEIDVSVLERPVTPASLGHVVVIGAQGAANREMTLTFASPTSGGELWTAGWRWWTNRPRAGLSIEAPRAGAFGSIWRAEGFWEEQTYRLAGPGETAASDLRESRSRASLAVSDWTATDLRWTLGGAFDVWRGRGRHASLAAGLEKRYARDRLALTAQGSWWARLAGGGRFGAAGIGARWRSGGADDATQWIARAGIAGATRRAPLDLWPGAGTGHARVPLLRAHPLLSNGVIDSDAFGRALAHGTLELQRSLGRAGPGRVRLAMFADAARAWERPGREAAGPLHVDAGAGVLLALPGQPGALRLDAARGLRDGSMALSLRWAVD